MQTYHILNRFSKEKRLVILLCLLFPVTAFSQIHGTVKDTIGNKLSNVVCKLTSLGSSRTYSKPTDNNGDFDFKGVAAGKYSVKISLVGFQAYVIDNLIVKEKDAIDLGSIILRTESRLLNEVKIRYKQPVYQQKMDKTIVNVGETISASGGSVLDVLERSPGVAVDRQNNTISMRGKEGVLVMINGKQTYLPISEVVQMLKGVGTGVVSKIELINNPSSDMDATGSAGVINIILKKGSILGQSFSYDVNGGYGRGGKFGGDLNYTNQFGRLSLSASYSGMYNNSKEEWKVNRKNDYHDSVFQVNTTTDRHPTNITNSGSLRLDYPVNDRLSFGANIQVYLKHWNMDADNNTNVSDGLVIHQTDREHDRWYDILSGVDSKYQINPNSFITVNADYLSYVNNNQHVYNNEYSVSGTTKTERINTDKHTPIHITVFKSDYNNKVSDSFNFKGGLKTAISSFTNNVAENNLDDPNNSLLVDLTGKDFLNENIYAAYSSAQFRLSSKISLDGGLRYEYTTSTLKDQNNLSLFDRKYGNLFPSVTAKYEINNVNTLQLGYNRRISRPSFVDIAPFIVFLDPNTYVTGNVELKPTLTDNYSISYKLDDYFFSLEYSNNTNSISTFQPVLNVNSNTLLLTPRNIDHFKVVSFTANAPYEVNTWWKFIASGTYSYQMVNTIYAYNERVNFSRNTVRLNITNNFTLPKGLSIELSGYVQSPFIVGITTRKIPGEVNFGLMKKLTERSSLSFVANDIFKTNIWTETNQLSTGNFSLHRNNNFETRVFRLSYAYKIGTTNHKGRERVDEEKRVN